MQREWNRKGNKQRKFCLWRFFREGKVFNTKDILNIKRDIIVEATKENFKYSEELGCFNNFLTGRETCSENKISVVYQTSKTRSIWEAYRDLLLMDSTYEVIEKDMELNWKAWAILAINGMNHTEVVCYFILKNETMACLNPVFNFLSNYNNLACYKSFLTDKKVKEINLIISFFQNCEHSYCDLHIKRRLLTIMSKTQRIRLDSISPLLKKKSHLLFKKRHKNNVVEVTMSETERNWPIIKIAIQYMLLIKKIGKERVDGY